MSPEEKAQALRDLPHGGSDDTARSLRLPPAIRATVSPLVLAVRWGAIVVGMVEAAPRTSDGDLQVVVAVGIVVFLATWRSVRPNRLGSPRIPDQLATLVDVALVGVSVGISSGFHSPFVWSLIVACVIGAFGWGLWAGLRLVAVGMACLALGAATTGYVLHLDQRRGWILLGLMVVSVVFTASVRNRLVTAEQRRVSVAASVGVLAETNELLSMLNAVARTLPTSLDLREAVSNARDQLIRQFDASVICLIAHDEGSDEWAPLLAEGCVLRPTATWQEVPEPLRTAYHQDDPLVVAVLGGRAIGETTRSGMYTTLMARDRVIGVLGVEHRDTGRFGPRESRLFSRLSEVLALTIDNARWFTRLRSLAAEEERSRIARDLHDRLGQWLTYISFELERIITFDPTAPAELNRLHGDVQTALDELRETLRQLRSGVTRERPLSVVGRELVQRFAERTDVDIRFRVANAGAALAVPVENELLRILQEALSNIDKHARATTVDVVWEVREGHGTLRITDDGRGFDPQTSVRDNAYGLVGMRERALAVDARLQIDSSPGRGTVITVAAGPHPEVLR